MAPGRPFRPENDKSFIATIRSAKYIEIRMMCGPAKSVMIIARKTKAISANAEIAFDMF